MAKKEIALEIKIEAANSAATLGELRSSLKALVEEQENIKRGTKEWKKLSDAINETEGKIGDLSDSFNTLKGSGIERVNASVGLFREGLGNFDFGKVKLGLQGLGAAFKAIPIFLIVEGVMKLYENFDKLKASGGLLGDVFKAIGEVIEWVTTKLTKFSDWLGITTIQAEKAAQAQIEAAEKTKKAVTERYDAEITLASAAGKKTTELEAQKARDVRKRIDAEMQAIIELSKITGDLSDDQKKKLEELGNERKKTILDEQVARAKSYKDLVDEIKKAQEEQSKKTKEANDKAKQDREKRLADSKKEADELFAELSKNQDNIDAHNKRVRDAERAAHDAELAYKKGVEDYYNKIRDEENKKIEEQVKKDHETDMARREEAAYKSIELARAVSDVFMTEEENKFNAEKNRLESALKNGELTAQEKYKLELELYNKEKAFRKKQFEVNKAFSAVAAIQDGIRAVQGALAQTATLGPGSIALAAVNGAIAAANVAKILATKFDEGSAPSMPNLSTGGSSGTNTVPTINNAANSAPIQATSFNEDGSNKNMVVKAVVVETDITDSQRRISKIERMSEF